MTMFMPNNAIPPLFTLADARRRLTAPQHRKPAALKMLAAAAILALSTLLLAGSVILGPFWQTKAPPSTEHAQPGQPQPGLRHF
jgi:hypothetical protein